MTKRAKFLASYGKTRFILTDFANFFFKCKTTSQVNVKICDNRLGI